VSFVGSKRKIPVITATQYDYKPLTTMVEEVQLIHRDTIDRLFEEQEQFREEMRRLNVALMNDASLMSSGLEQKVRIQMASQHLLIINHKLNVQHCPLTTISNWNTSNQYNRQSLFFCVAEGANMSSIHRDHFLKAKLETQAKKAAIKADAALANLQPYDDVTHKQLASNLRKCLIEFMCTNLTTTSFTEMSTHFNTTMEEQVAALKSLKHTIHPSAPFVVKILACMLNIDIKLYTASCIFFCKNDKLQNIAPVSKKMTKDWHHKLKIFMAFDGMNYHLVSTPPNGIPLNTSKPVEGDIDTWGANIPL
jgi:hypothetical protein